MGLYSYLAAMRQMQLFKIGFAADGILIFYDLTVLFNIVIHFTIAIKYLQTHQDIWELLFTLTCVEIKQLAAFSIVRTLQCKKSFIKRLIAFWHFQEWQERILWFVHVLIIIILLL